jgi:hypothetical protein
VGFVVDKVALGQVFSEYFGFSCQSLFHQILHQHNYLGQVQEASSGRRAEWTQFHSPLCKLKKKLKSQFYSCSTKQVLSGVMFWTFIWEMLASNLGQAIRYLY